MSAVHDRWWRQYEAVRRHRVPHLVHTSSVGAIPTGKQGAPRRRVVADRRHRDVVVLASQGGRAATARRNGRHPARGPAATPPDLPATPPLRSPATSSGLSCRPACSVPGCRRYWRSPTRSCSRPCTPTAWRRRSWRYSTGAATGPFNLAAAPVVTPSLLAQVLHARRKGGVGDVRGTLQPTEPGWLDLALSVPLLDTSRARDLLDWHPGHGAD
jgi:hypothetical protein